MESVENKLVDLRYPTKLKLFKCHEEVLCLVITNILKKWKLIEDHVIKIFELSQLVLFCH